MAVGGASLLALALGAAASGQEAGRNSEELFKVLDKNGDGVVKADEVGEERARFFERLVRVADKNSDGALSREEFIAGTKTEERTAPPSAERPAGERPAGERPDGRRFFERFDANKDGKVTKDEVPEEFRNRLNPVFERLGKNELTQEEFTRAMAQFAGRTEGGAPGGAEIEQVFKRADANGDGKVTLDEAPENVRPILNGVFRRLMREPKDGITLDELRTAMADRRPGEGRPGEGRPADGPRPMPRFFQLADANGDGRVTKEELGKLVEKFSELDENNDGQLDPRELLGAPPGGRPEERRPEGNRPEGNRPEGQRPGDQAGELFRRQDKNGDGKISREEAGDRLKENFDRIDGDGDGFLSREEVARGLLRRAQEGGERPRPEGERRPGANPEKKPE
jgi:Ca2+-binding EF-hand superfamily protein